MYYASGIDYKNTMNNAYRLCVLFNTSELIEQNEAYWLPTDGDNLMSIQVTPRFEETSDYITFFERDAYKALYTTAELSEIDNFLTKLKECNYSSDSEYMNCTGRLFALFERSLKYSAYRDLIETSEDTTVQWLMVNNCNVTEDIIRELVRDYAEDDMLIEAIAKCEITPLDILDNLSKSEDEWVREGVAERDKETLNDILNERRIGGFAVCFEGAISQSMLQEHYDIKDYFGKADYVYSDCGDGEFSLVFYIAQYEDKTIDYLFNDDGYHCNDLNKEMEEERQRAKAADKRMELFERGFKEQFMYER